MEFSGSHMSEKRIGELWESYRQVLPRTASATQVIETRRAFYAGAQGLFHSILTMLEPGEDATDGDLSKMDAIQKELHDFAKLIESGVA